MRSHLVQAKVCPSLDPFQRNLQQICWILESVPLGIQVNDIQYTGVASRTNLNCGMLSRTVSGNMSVMIVRTFNMSTQILTLTCLLQLHLESPKTPELAVSLCKQFVPLPKTDIRRTQFSQSKERGSLLIRIHIILLGLHTLWKGIP